jgi:hypothetical protein
VAGIEGRWSQCAQLAGASAALHEQIGAPPWESVVMLQQRETAEARRALGPGAYEECMRRGRSLAVDDVLRQTLDARVLDLPGW